MRFHYVPVDERRWELSRVVDPDGNTTELTYSGSGQTRQLRRVTDSSGRILDFFYAARETPLWTRDLLVRVSAPDGIEMRFDYDSRGSLSSATSLPLLPATPSSPPSPSSMKRSPEP